MLLEDSSSAKKETHWSCTFVHIKKSIVWEFLFILNPLLIVYSNPSLKGTWRCLFIQSVVFLGLIPKLSCFSCFH